MIGNPCIDRPQVIAVLPVSGAELHCRVREAAHRSHESRRGIAPTNDAKVTPGNATVVCPRRVCWSVVDRCGGPRRPVLAAGHVRQICLFRAIGVHDEDLEIPGSVALEDNAASVAGPDRILAAHMDSFG